MMPLITLGFNLLVELRLVLPLMLKRALIVVCTTLLIASMHTQADPLSALQATSNLLHVTSLADMIAKAATTGIDTRTLKTVPRLVVMVDCGDCKLSNTNKMVITSAYNELAKTSGMVIDAKQPIIFNVTSLFARNSFLRGTFGILSGADHISGQLEGAANQTIGEFSVAHEMGFDEIAELLGEDILKAVITNHINAAEIKPRLIHPTGRYYMTIDETKNKHNHKYHSGRQPKICAGLLLTIIRKSVLTIEATNTLLNPIKQLNEAITKMVSKRLLTLLLRTIKYAYFSPFTAAWCKLKRGGGYIRYVLALHRLAKWHLN